MELLKQQLESDEKLIWCGKPAQGILFYPVDIFMIPFSLLWGGIALIWEYFAIILIIKKPEVNHLFFPVFGIPFAFVGLYMLFGRYIIDKKQRENIQYGISNKRIFIIRGKKKQSIVRLNLNRLKSINIKERKDGRGTIIFGEKDFFDFFYVKGVMPRDKFTSPKFEMIENVREVYNKIKEAAEVDRGQVCP